jgi:hypothetical protein
MEPDKDNEYICICPKCGRGHGGVTPMSRSGLMPQVVKPCDKCKQHVTTSQRSAIHYATMVTGASIYSLEAGEYV